MVHELGPVRRSDPALKQVGKAGMAARRGWTLHEPAAAGDLATCNRLVAQGADVQGRDDNGWTALRWAVQYSHAHVVAFLLDHGADATARFTQNKTCLHQSAYTGSLEVAKLLIEKGGADANAIDDQGWSVSDVVYCPPDAPDDFRDYLKHRGGKRNRTSMFHGMSKREKFDPNKALAEED